MNANKSEKKTKFMIVEGKGVDLKLTWICRKRCLVDDSAEEAIKINKKRKPWSIKRGSIELKNDNTEHVEDFKEALLQRIWSEINVKISVAKGMGKESWFEGHWTKM